MKLVREKKHRLSKELYNGNIAVMFTICLEGNVNLSTNPNIFRKFEETILLETGRFNCQALIYLFMPDHCHVLLQGDNEKAKAMNVIIEFKRKTRYWLSRNYPAIRWQKDYYDHILRKDEDRIEQTNYILNNPVRKGLVIDWQKYKFKGSTIYNFDEW
jgi:putative transposase